MDAIRARLVAEKQACIADNCQLNHEVTIGTLIFHVHAESDIDKMIQLAQLTGDKRPNIIGPCKVGSDAQPSQEETTPEPETTEETTESPQ